ncbi:preprotein translocase subunit SecG [Pusillimonas noertemannii]|uniref:Protein-export membrane protein SecG n=1 Tax=Pusillimonas noertemannii TaxID=305977 RepID=A0A2U1CRS3_9BURK|nr:preprotein translocase subunit SecG [Pusillimonas noertemannii]NYT67925.1 preprotein translocase subunit SecG [Pusillimonas noertemannii]PVY68595.1 protein translocase subunit secG [Pusillimonas noertemannii]TFL11932.1 preprotein translocase subunit SecG [Pusillimonas noertemannii]
MNWLSPLLLAIQVITSLSIIVLVLLQQGKGSEMGSAFGSGSAGSLFGASGAANFLSRMTKWAAIIFFLSTIGLAYTAHRTGDSILDGGLMQDYQAPPPPAAGSAVPSVPGGEAAPGEQAPQGQAVPSAPAEGASTPPAADSAPAPAQNSQVPEQPAQVPEAPAQSAP